MDTAREGNRKRLIQRNLGFWGQSSGETHYLHDKEVEATSQKQSTAEERQRTYYLCQGLSSQAGHKLATVKGVGKGFSKPKWRCQCKQGTAEERRHVYP